ncbi:unnamed protein product [Natator depressus]
MCLQLAVPPPSSHDWQQRKEKAKRSPASGRRSSKHYCCSGEGVKETAPRKLKDLKCDLAGLLLKSCSQQEGKRTGEPGVTPVCSTVKARTSERTADLLHPNYLISEVVKWKHMEGLQTYPTSDLQHSLLF